MLKQVEIEFLSTGEGVVNLIELISSLYDAATLSTIRIYDLEKPPMKEVGLGRIGYLNTPISIRQVTEIVKNHFNIKAFRIALANGKSLGNFLGIRSV